MTTPPLAPRRRALPVLLAAFTVLVLTGLASAASTPWRALYAGVLGGEQVIVDLTLPGSGTAWARVLIQGRGVSLTGRGTEAEDGAIAVDLRPSEQGFSPTFAFLYGMQDGGEAPAPVTPVVARLTGLRHQDWTDDGATLSASVAFEAATGGRAGVLAGDLARVAQYAYLTLQEGRIEGSSAWPRFRGALGELSAAREEGELALVRSFVADGRQNEDGLTLGWGWTDSAYQDLMGAAGDYVSFLTSVDTYTGGAHPNTYYDSTLYELGTGRTVTLGELFDPSVDWLAPVLDLVTADLRAQGAMWLLDDAGDLKVTLAEKDLATFALGPAGLSFVFDPYAVGPYVQGNFVVTLPFEDLAALVPEDGAVAAFAAAVPPRAFD